MQSTGLTGSILSMAAMTELKVFNVGNAKLLDTQISKFFQRYEFQDTFDDDKRQKSAISGSFLHWMFLVFSSGFSFFFSRFSLQFSKQITPICGENRPISRREKMKKILSRLWVLLFSVPKVVKTLCSYKIGASMRSLFTDPVFLQVNAP